MSGGATGSSNASALPSSSQRIHQKGYFRKNYILSQTLHGSNLENTKALPNTPKPGIGVILHGNRGHQAKGKQKHGKEGDSFLVEHRRGHRRRQLRNHNGGRFASASSLVYGNTLQDTSPAGFVPNWLGNKTSMTRAQRFLRGAQQKRKLSHIYMNVKKIGNNPRRLANLRRTIFYDSSQYQG